MSNAAKNFDILRTSFSFI